SPIDPRILRDLEVMKLDHDLDTTVTEGSLAVIRERYSIPVEYGLHVPQLGQRPYSLDAHLGGCSRGRSPVSSASTHRRMPEVVEDLPQPGSAQLVDRLKGILSSSRAIKEMIELWLVEVGLSPASRGDQWQGPSDLPRCPGGRCFSRKGSPEGFVKEASQRTGRAGRGCSEVPQEGQSANEGESPRHKSRLGEGESRSRSKGKEPVAPSEEPETPVESEEGGASPAHRRPRSMKDLFKTKVHKDDAGYYTLLMSDLGHQNPEKEMKARWKGLKNSTKVWNNSSAVEEFERGLLHPQLARELYTLPSKVLMARAAKEMVLVSFPTYDLVVQALPLPSF
ncbi:hypothetical protein BHM03_00059632, partial [Ensete ventricosum]